MKTAVPRFSSERLRALRQGAGMTQSELARRARLREQQIIRWEGGRNVPSADSVGVLAAALGCDVADLFAHGSAGESDEDDEESDLFAAAHRLDVAGEYELANRLRSRARQAARKQARS